MGNARIQRGVYFSIIDMKYVTLISCALLRDSCGEQGHLYDVIVHIRIYRLQDLIITSNSPISCFCDAHITQPRLNPSHHHAFISLDSSPIS